MIDFQRHGNGLSHSNGVQVQEGHNNKPVNMCTQSCSTLFTALEEWSRAINRVLHSTNALTITHFWSHDFQPIGCVEKCAINHVKHT